MTYSEAVDYILDIPKFTKKNDAAHTKAFLKTLGDPQRKMRIIHVAGTNGKGSVCAYLDGMLRSEQKRTGLFTSPHLVKINERIVIDGQMISDERFLEVFEETSALFCFFFNYRIAFSRRLRIIYGNMRLDNARFFRCDLLQRISEILFMIKTDRSDH